MLAVKRPIGFLSYCYFVLIAATLTLFTIQPWSYRVSGILPVQILITWIVFTSLLFRGRTSLRQIAQTFTGFQWLLLFALLSIMAYRSAFEVTWLYFQQCLTGVMLAIVVASVFLHSVGQRFVLWSLCLATGLSSAVAILQYAGFAEWSWKYSLYAVGHYRVPSGLETFPVAFSYSVVATTVCMFAIGLHGVLIRTPKLTLLPPWLALSVGFLELIAMAAAVSRSGVLACILGVAGFLFLISRIGLSLGMSKLHIILPALLLTIPVLYYLTSSSIFVQLGEEVGTATEDSRVSETWARFTPVLLSHPFGISGQVLLADQHAREGLAESPVLRSALRKNNGHLPHNLVLTTGLFYGSFAAIIGLMFLFSIYHHAFRLLSKSREVALTINDGVVVCMLLAANLSLFIHSWFHNATPFVGEMRWWAWIGMLSGYAVRIRNEKIVK